MYTTPELLSLGSATNLVLANESNIACLGPDNVAQPHSYIGELW